MLRLTTLLISLLLVLPAAAQAGTVSLAVERDCAGDEGDPACYVSHRVRWTGAPGEVNDVVVDRTADAVVLREAGAPLTAGPGCTQTAPGEARCVMDLRPERGRDLQASLALDGGDAYDRLAIGTVAGRLDDLSVSGGAGDDALDGADARPAPVSRAGGGSVTLVGGEGDDRLLGGAADETLLGGPGPDVLRAGSGNDFLDGEGTFGAPTGEVSADVLDGGPGRDLVSYDGHRVAVHVTLGDSATDGQMGEGDTIVAVEDVRGSQFGNILQGDDGPNRLWGAANSRVTDHLEGRGGDDWLSGEAGPDDYVGGGDGNDRIVHRRGAARPYCGAGTDVLEPGQTLTPQPGCERVLLAGVMELEVRPVVTGRRTLVLRVRARGRVRGVLALGVRGRRVSRGRVDVPSGRTARLRVRMGRTLPGGRSSAVLTFARGGGLPAASVRLNLRR